MKRINLSKEKRAWLQRAFGVSHVTIWSALNYVTESPLAKQIRRMALANGGVVENRIFVSDGFLPNCQTEYERDENGSIIAVSQSFMNGVRVFFDNGNNRATLFQGKNAIEEYEDVRMHDWSNILFRAQSLSESLNE